MIRIKFVDFWPGFDGRFFLWILAKAGYKAEAVDTDPDLVIYSVFGNEHQRYSCTKIFFTGENRRPPAGEYAISFDYDEDPMHIRFPLYTYHRWVCSEEGDSWGGKQNLSIDKIFEKKEMSMEELLRMKTQFCVFMQGNASCQHRNEFFQRLNARKRVVSAGSLFNNHGRIVGWHEKLMFVQPFKFMIAFENSAYPGYVTEKIFEPMLVNTVPIYWGSITASGEFNPKSYIDVNRLSVDEAVDLVLQIDSDDERYYEMYKEPYVIDNPYLDFDNLVKFFQNILQ